jgi:hypothetical protein
LELQHKLIKKQEIGMKIKITIISYVHLLLILMLLNSDENFTERPKTEDIIVKPGPSVVMRKEEEEHRDRDRDKRNYRSRSREEMDQKNYRSRSREKYSESKRDERRDDYTREYIRDERRDARLEYSRDRRDNTNDARLEYSRDRRSDTSHDRRRDTNDARLDHRRDIVSDDRPIHIHTHRHHDLRDHVNVRDGDFSDRNSFERRQHQNHRNSPPTTESLKSKKLAALDHEKFLMSRQAERDAVPLKDVSDLIWPRTPPHQKFEFDFSLVEGETQKTAAIEAVESDEKCSDGAKTEEFVAEEDKFGPSLVIKSATNAPMKANVFSSRQNYGSDMMPGEGTAMAGFVSQGQRIPRRGEIGLDSDQITRFETAGYVMSGSRHHLMNAVRMRKENQVISVEEKKMISQMALEERIKREEEIIKTFKAMVDEKLKIQQQQNNHHDDDNNDDEK